MKKVDKKLIKKLNINGGKKLIKKVEIGLRNFSKYLIKEVDQNIDQKSIKNFNGGML